MKKWRKLKWKQLEKSVVYKSLIMYYSYLLIYVYSKFDSSEKTRSAPWSYNTKNIFIQKYHKIFFHYFEELGGS
jgi:hypothetical protein